MCDRESWFVRARTNLFVVLILGFIGAAFFLIGPIPQDLSYHRFADQRSIWGIPNFFNVVSNLPFLMVGLKGAVFCLKEKQLLARRSWQIFFIGLCLVALGSSFYHWAPSSRTLVWDRLPMTISFMGLFIAVLSESINPNIERHFLIAAILMGIASVFYWDFTDDLRFYALIQFGPLISLPIVLLFCKRRYSHRHYLGYALFWYGLAKLCEIYDQEIYQLDNQVFCGHSLKHLLAGISVYCVYRMLRVRRAFFQSDMKSSARGQ